MAQPIVILPDPPPAPTPLGLIAAGGRLPILVAQGMRDSGHEVRCVGLSGQYDEGLRDYCDQFREVGTLRLTSWARGLRRMDITHAVMVGRIDKARLLHNWVTLVKGLPDYLLVKQYLKSRSDRRSHVILGAIARELSVRGIELIDSTAHIPKHMSTTGNLTIRRPTPGQRGDIEFGWPLLQEMLRLDVGQAMAVRERDVVAIEAVEGTDRMIERAGALCRHAGWTLLKGARAGHDRRSDVPTVGPDTVENLHKAGGRCIAVASGDVIMIDKADTIALADKLGVAIVGVPPI